MIDVLILFYMQQLSIVFDLETTGFRGLPLFSEFNRIVQICAIDISDHTRVFNTFVYPGGKIPHFSSQIHNIYDKDIENAPTIEDVLKQFETFFEFKKYKTVELIAHNANWFDAPILRKEYRRAKRDFPSNVIFFDTLPFFRKQYPGLEKYNLSYLHKHFFYKEIENAHRADADVGALLKLYVNYVCDKRNNPMYLTCSDCLTEMYYIGPQRAFSIIQTINCETVADLKHYWKKKRTTVDFFLRNILKVNDITQRMILASQFLDIDVTSPQLREYLILDIKEKDCLNKTDYYVKFKYYDQQKSFNRFTFQKGLLSLKNVYL